MYKWDAEDYKKNSMSQYQWALELVNKLELKGSENVLDIGCGDGRISALIAGKLTDGRVTAIDSSNDMIGFARQAFPGDQFPNLEFRHLDALDLDYIEAFDVVFSNAVLHWIKDQVTVLKGIYNSLKPGGKALLQMGGKGNAEDEVEILLEMISDEKWKKYFKDFEFPWSFNSPDQYFPWVIKSGLKPDRIELIKKDMIHEGEEGLKGWIRSTWLPYTLRVPEAKRQEFIDELVSMLTLNRPPDEKGNYHIKMIRLEAELEK